MAGVRGTAYGLMVEDDDGRIEPLRAQSVIFRLLGRQRYVPEEGDIDVDPGELVVEDGTGREIARGKEVEL